MLQDKLNKSIILAINKRNYAGLINLTLPYPELDPVIITNAVYAALHLVVADTKETPNLPASILELITKYYNQYNLLATDIKMLYLFINKYNIKNISLFAKQFLPSLPVEYRYMFVKIFSTKIAIEAIYQQLQDMWSHKICNDLEQLLTQDFDIRYKLDSILSDLNKKLACEIIKNDIDFKNILAKPLQLLEKHRAKQEYLLFLYTHYKPEIILPEWQDEPIENSRLYKFYKASCC